MRGVLRRGKDGKIQKLRCSHSCLREKSNAISAPSKESITACSPLTSGLTISKALARWPLGEPRSTKRSFS